MQEVRVMEFTASFACKDDSKKPKEFCLENLSIAPVESTALFQFLSCIKNLNKLRIFYCRMEHFAFRKLSQLLITDNELTELAIKYSNMTYQHAKHIADALRSENCKLTKLDISRNVLLTDESTKYLSDALQSNDCQLTKLDMAYNTLTHESGKYLSDALKSEN